MDRDVPAQRTPLPRDASTGRVPLAVAVVDERGLVSHWSSGARRLFGVTRQGAVGSPAGELLPVSGVLGQAEEDGTGFGPESEGAPVGTFCYPTAGRARVDEPERGRIDVLWWAYPLVGPGSERLLVLAADAGRLAGGGKGDGRDTGTVAPAFALHTDFPGYQELAGRLPEILPSMSVGEATRIVAQVLELGYPVLEFSHRSRVPVTPDWGVPRRTSQHFAHSPRSGGDGAPAPRAVPRPELDLEYAAVRERLEFLNEVSGRIGTSSTWNAPSARSPAPPYPASPTSRVRICAPRSSPVRASRTGRRTSPPSGTGSGSSTTTSPAAGTTPSRSASPSPFPSTPRSSSAWSPVSRSSSRTSARS